MKLLIDMNLSPEWVPVFKKQGWEAIHWSQVGDPRAPDHDIMQWAKTNHHVVFTHDLDLGAILAASQTDRPSVIQVRTQNVHPDSLGALVFQILRQYSNALEKGALVTVDEGKSRVRLLPF